MASFFSRYSSILEELAALISNAPLCRHTWCEAKASASYNFEYLWGSKWLSAEAEKWIRLFQFCSNINHKFQLLHSFGKRWKFFFCTFFFTSTSSTGFAHTYKTHFLRNIGLTLAAFLLTTTDFKEPLAVAKMSHNLAWAISHYAWGPELSIGLFILAAPFWAKVHCDVLFYDFLKQEFVCVEREKSFWRKVCFFLL